jgi:hypothetical protein
MSGMLGAGEGKLRIQIQVEKGVIASVALASTRAIRACSILAGRRLDEAMALLPRLFSLCGVAQAVAGLTAVEAALDLVPSPPQTAARQILVAAEALEQTVWRLLIDGPRCVGVRPALEALKPLRATLASLRPLLFADPGWVRIGGARLTPDRPGLAAVLDEIERGVDRAVLGRSPREDSPWQDRADFVAWVRAAVSPAAMILRWVSGRGLADFGRSAVAPLPEFDPVWLARRLAHDADHSFCARPDHLGAVGETGALARCWNHPAIAPLRAEYGSGLLARLAARVIECGALVAELRGQAQMVCDENPETPNVATASGSGLGVVECARGRLVHWLAVAEGRVSAYRILAPTEWNFHPEGPLARGLVGARVGRRGGTVRQAIELLVMALDPCVGFELAIIVDIS